MALSFFIKNDLINIYYCKKQNKMVSLTVNLSASVHSRFSFCSHTATDYNQGDIISVSRVPAG